MLHHAIMTIPKAIDKIDEALTFAILVHNTTPKACLRGDTPAHCMFGYDIIIPQLLDVTPESTQP